MNNPRDSRHQLTTGLIMIALGVLLLLDRLDVIRFSYAMHLYWPVLLILIGVARLARRISTNSFGDHRENSF